MGGGQVIDDVFVLGGGDLGQKVGVRLGAVLQNLNHSIGAEGFAAHSTPRPIRQHLLGHFFNWLAVAREQVRLLAIHVDLETAVGVDDEAQELRGLA